MRCYGLRLVGPDELPPYLNAFGQNSALWRFLPPLARFDRKASRNGSIESDARLFGGSLSAWSRYFGVSVQRHRSQPNAQDHYCSRRVHRP